MDQRYPSSRLFATAIIAACLMLALNVRAAGTTVVELCNGCTVSKHVQKARAHAQGGYLNRARVYSMDLVKDELHGFDVYTESEPGFTTTIVDPVAIPNDIAQEWLDILAFQYAVRSAQEAGLDLTDISLMETLADGSEGIRTRDLVGLRAAGQHLPAVRERLENLIGTFNRLWKAAPSEARQTVIKVFFADGTRFYTIRWDSDMFGNPLAWATEVKSTARDLLGNPIPDDPQTLNDVLDANGFFVFTDPETLARVIGRLSVPWRVRVVWVDRTIQSGTVCLPGEGDELICTGSSPGSPN